MQEKGCTPASKGHGVSLPAPQCHCLNPTLTPQVQQIYEQPCLRRLGRGKRDVPQKRGAEPALSPPLKCTRFDHLPLNFRGRESKVNLPGWLTHSFGSRGGDVALFRPYFPAEAALGVSRARCL